MDQDLWPHQGGKDETKARSLRDGSFPQKTIDWMLVGTQPTSPACLDKICGKKGSWQLHRSTPWQSTGKQTKKRRTSCHTLAFTPWVHHRGGASKARFESAAFDFQKGPAWTALDAPIGHGSVDFGFQSGFSSATFVGSAHH